MTSSYSTPKLYIFSLGHPNFVSEKHDYRSFRLNYLASKFTIS